MTNDHIAGNRADWNAESDAYQARNESQLDHRRLAWGTWAIPEAELGALGDQRGKRVLELGCGAAQWARFLAEDGAHPVGMDLAERQLAHARTKLDAAGVRVPLVQGSAEELPFGDACFDTVFCDHGATSFSDPHRTIPEAARVLRPGGLFVFNLASPLRDICAADADGRPTETLERDYFALHRIDEDGSACFNLPYGEWIRLFRASGLELLDLIELRPPVGATTTYAGYIGYDWARRWPAENLWRLERR